MCIDYTSLNKACPKDPFALPRIDQVIDSTAGCELLSFLDAYSGYHQIKLNPSDQIKTSFITLTRARPVGPSPFVYLLSIKTRPTRREPKQMKPSRNKARKSIDLEYKTSYLIWTLAPYRSRIPQPA